MGVRIPGVQWRACRWRGLCCWELRGWLLWGRFRAGRVRYTRSRDKRKSCRRKGSVLACCMTVMCSIPLRSHLQTVTQRTPEIHPNLLHQPRSSAFFVLAPCGLVMCSDSPRSSEISTQKVTYRVQIHEPHLILHTGCRCVSQCSSCNPMPTRRCTIYKPRLDIDSSARDDP